MTSESLMKWSSHGLPIIRVISANERVSIRLKNREGMMMMERIADFWNGLGDLELKRKGM